MMTPPPECLTPSPHTRAAAWFRILRDSICAEFEAIEAEYAAGLQQTSVNSRERSASDREAAGYQTHFFTLTPWSRPEGGGGVMGMMKGEVFEKVGVNISTVHGEFSEAFRKEIPGAESDPRFLATGISLVAHPKNPHVPAAHMNTRMIMVGGDVRKASGEREEAQGADHAAQRNEGGEAPARGGATAPPCERSEQKSISAQRIWFGGGGDLNPAIPYPEDTAEFHAAFRATCDEADPAFYPAFSDWCEEYFYLPHRGHARGVGGIFYDYLGLARLGADTSPVTSGRFGKGGLNGERTFAGMQIANHAPLDWEQAFRFTQSVGTTFRDSYARLVRRRMHTPFTENDKQRQLAYRGRYAEYNLLYDRGTRFGLMTGGNPEAILMSLPPVAIWE